MDKISPTHYFHTLDDTIKDVAFLPSPAADDGLVLLAISGSGLIYSQPLSSAVPNASDGGGPIILTDVLDVPSELSSRLDAVAALLLTAVRTPLHYVC